MLLLCQPSPAPSVDCGFYGKNGPKEMKYLQEEKGIRHAASCLAEQPESQPGRRFTSNKGFLLLVRPREAAAAWSEGPGIRGSSGSLPEDGSRRESACAPASGGIPKRRSRTRGASARPTNSSGAGRRFSSASLANRLAARIVSFRDNCSEPGVPNQLSQKRPCQGRLAASTRRWQPERRDTSRG